VGGGERGRIIGDEAENASLGKGSTPLHGPGRDADGERATSVMQDRNGGPFDLRNH
jgi:hypothetical protein